MASPTTSGAAAQVPSPSEGILAPVFNLKKRNPSSICERNVCEHYHTLFSFITFCFFIETENSCLVSTKNMPEIEKWTNRIAKCNREDG